MTFSKKFTFDFSKIA